MRFLVRSQAGKLSLLFGIVEFWSVLETTYSVKKKKRFKVVKQHAGESSAAQNEGGNAD